MRRNTKRRTGQGFWAVAFEQLPMVGGAIGMVVVLAYLFFHEQGWPLYRHVVERQRALTLETQQLAASTRNLREQIERLQSDRSTLERVARDRLGMVRDGEVVFQFVEPKTGDGPHAP